MWSGSDYSERIHRDEQSNNWFACVGGLTRLESVKEHTSNGERSIKCNFIDSLDYCEYHIYDFDESKSYRASFEVYSESTGVVLQLLAICSENRGLDTVKTISCPPSTQTKLSATFTQEELQSYHSEIKIRCLSNISGVIVYVDNWEVLETE